MASHSKVYFFFDGVQCSFSQRGRLKSFIEKIFKKEGKKLDTLNYIFCTDEKLLQINREFLNHDYYTDIITFNLSPNTHTIQGEVYISIDRVKDNARQLNEPIYKELHRVIFHGMLHLCGYADKTPKEITLMRSLEAKYLKQYF